MCVCVIKLRFVNQVLYSSDISNAMIRIYAVPAGVVDIDPDTRCLVSRGGPEPASCLSQTGGVVAITKGECGCFQKMDDCIAAALRTTNDPNNMQFYNASLQCRTEYSQCVDRVVNEACKQCNKDSIVGDDHPLCRIFRYIPSPSSS